MSLETALLIDLAKIVVAATVMNYIVRIFKQPSLLGYILAGIIMGPIVLGSMVFPFGDGVITLGIPNIEEIIILSELGIAFLLFSIGIETDFSRLISMGKTVVIGGTLQVLVIIASVIGLSEVFGILSFEQSVFIGVILAFSSTMVVVKQLSDSFQINTLHGRLMVGFLILQDILVVFAIPLLQNLGADGSSNFFGIILNSAILIISAVLLNKYIFPRLYRFSLKYSELFYLTAVSNCFVFIQLSLFLGIPIAIGAFFSGLALSTLPYNIEIFSKIRGLRDFFVTIFFVTLGMQLTFNFGAFPIGLLLMIVGIVFILKPLAFYLVSLGSGFGSRVSFLVAAGLAQVSEFSFILAGQGRNAGILSADLFSLLVFVIAVSMVITPYMFNYSNRAYSLFSRISEKIPRKLKHKRFSSRIKKLEKVPVELKDHVIIIGGGTTGYGIAASLKGNVPLVIVDHDSEVITSCINKGFNAVYGAADSEEIMEKINLKDAKLLVIAIPDIKSAIFLADLANKTNPKLVVFARAHYYRNALRLYQNNVDFVVLPHVIGANVFLEKVAEFLETGKLYHVSNLKSEFIKFLEEKSAEEQEHFGL